MTSDRPLPDGWRRVHFGDVVHQVKEKIDLPIAGLTRYIAGEHMDTDDLKLRRWGEMDDGYLGPAFHMRFKPGHVLYGSRRTYLRKVAVADFEGICANTTFVLESKSTDLLSEFLPQIMSTEKFHEHSVQQSKGSVNPYINFRDLTLFEFALPPVEQQESILEVLKSAYQVADETARVRTALESLRDALIDTAIWDASCGRWSVPLVRVGDLLDGKPRNGLSPKASSKSDTLRTVALSAVRDGRFIADGATEKWCEPSSRAPQFCVEAGDVFVVRGNGNRRLVGRAGLALAKPEPPCIYPDLLIRLRFGPQIDPFLATALWNHKRVHDRLLGRAKSSNGIYKVNGNDVAVHELPVPPVAESRALSIRLRAIDDLQTLCEAHVIAAGKLVSALREKALHPDGFHDV